MLEYNFFHKCKCVKKKIKYKKTLFYFNSTKFTQLWTVLRLINLNIINKKIPLIIQEHTLKK